MLPWLSKLLAETGSRSTQICTTRHTGLAGAGGRRTTEERQLCVRGRSGGGSVAIDVMEERPERPHAIPVRKVWLQVP